MGILGILKKFQTAPSIFFLELHVGDGDVVAKGNLLDHLQGLGRLQAQLRAAVNESSVQNIQVVVLHPGLKGPKKLLLEAALVHDGYRVERVEPEVEHAH